MIPVISLIGASKAGKTSLLEKIIEHVKDRGYKTAVIKHSTAVFDFGEKNKDTDRLRSAGADKVVFSGPSEFVIQEKVSQERCLEEIISLIEKDVDILFTEGYKERDYPKIEITEPGQKSLGTCGSTFKVVDKQILESPQRIKELVDEIIFVYLS